MIDFESWSMTDTFKKQTWYDFTESKLGGGGRDSDNDGINLHSRSNTDNVPRNRSRKEGIVSGRIQV